MQKIKRGDEVIVIAGKDKGSRGVVSKVILSGHPKRVIKAIVSGINLVKKHKKPDTSKNDEGGIISKEMPIDISNVALFNRSTNKADKVGFKFIDNKKVRYFKSNQEVVDVR